MELNHDAISVIWRIPRSSKPAARSRSWWSSVTPVASFVSCET
jgi:hypothetical protein